MGLPAFELEILGFMFQKNKGYMFQSLHVENNKPA